MSKKIKKTFETKCVACNNYFFVGYNSVKEEVSFCPICGEEIIKDELDETAMCNNFNTLDELEIDDEDSNSEKWWV